MANLPLKGIQSETANRFDVDVRDIRDVDWENGVLRPVRNEISIKDPAASTAQSIAYLPGASSPNQFVELTTSFSTRWGRHVLAVHPTYWQAHTQEGSSIYTATYPSLNAPTVVNALADYPFALRLSSNANDHSTTIDTTTTYSSINTNFSIITMTGSLIMGGDRTASTTYTFHASTRDLQEYNSLLIESLLIEPVSGVSFDNVYFVLVAADGTETMAPVLSWGSRQLNVKRTKKYQAPYSRIHLRNLELDISGIPRSNIMGLRIYWLVFGPMTDEEQPPTTWQVELKWKRNPEDTSNLPRLQTGGSYQSGAWSWTAALACKDTRSVFSGLFSQSANATPITRIMGGSRKYFTADVIVRLPIAFVDNWYTNPPDTYQQYELVLGSTQGVSWQEAARRTINLPHAVNLAGFGSGAPTEVLLYTPVTNQPFVARDAGVYPWGALVMIRQGSVREIVRMERVREAAETNRYRITARGLEGTIPSSFGANAEFIFLDYAFWLNRPQVAKGWVSGGSLPYGPVLTAYDRVICADLASRFVHFSTKNHPLCFPSLALTDGDGFGQLIADTILEIALDKNVVLAYGRQQSYALVIPDKGSQTVPMVFQTPRPRNYGCASNGYILTKDGIYQGNQLVFPADYSDMTKSARIVFTGTKLYWFYGTTVYWMEAGDDSVYKRNVTLAGTANSILDLDVYEDDAVLLIRRTDNSRGVWRLRGGSSRIANGYIEYGTLANEKRMQIQRIYVWGKNLTIEYITPLGTTTRTLNNEGFLAMDVHAPQRKLTHEFQIRITFNSTDSYLERIMVEPLVSDMP